MGIIKAPRWLGFSIRARKLFVDSCLYQIMGAMLTFFALSMLSAKMREHGTQDKCLDLANVKSYNASGYQTLPVSMPLKWSCCYRD